MLLLLLLLLPLAYLLPDEPLLRLPSIIRVRFLHIELLLLLLHHSLHVSGLGVIVQSSVLVLLLLALLTRLLPKGGLLLVLRRLSEVKAGYVATAVNWLVVGSGLIVMGLLAMGFVDKAWRRHQAVVLSGV